MAAMVLNESQWHADKEVIIMHNIVFNYMYVIYEYNIVLKKIFYYNKIKKGQSLTLDVHPSSLRPLEILVIGGLIHIAYMIAYIIYYIIVKISKKLYIIFGKTILSEAQSDIQYR